MQKITDIFAGSILMFFILSAAVTVTLGFRPLYYFDMDYLDISESSGYSEEEIKENYDALIDYNIRGSVKRLVFPTFPMSEEAEVHFAEVKEIFQFFIRLCIANGAGTAVLAFWKRKKRQYGYLKAAGIMTLAFPAALGLLIGLNWERSFVLFHELMFRNDYWLFDPATDPVITILPDEYFFHCAMLILILAATGAGICFTLYFITKRKGEK